MLFVDSCDPLAVQEIFAMGIASGVTTNPLILAKRSAELGPAEIAPLLENLLNASADESMEMGGGPVFVQLTAQGESDMMREALGYIEIGKRIGIKIPFSEVGLRVAFRLAAKDVWTNVTSIMSPAQAYVAMMAGVEYLSIFVGRIHDMGYNANLIISEVRASIAREGWPVTKIIAGSIRQPADVMAAHVAGAHVVTASPEILKKLLWNPQTERTNAEFERASQGL